MKEFWKRTGEVPGLRFRTLIILTQALVLGLQLYAIGSQRTNLFIALILPFIALTGLYWFSREQSRKVK